MRFGIVGLGRIGPGLARQAREKGHQVVGYNRIPEPTRELDKEGLEFAYSPTSRCATSTPRTSP